MADYLDFVPFLLPGAVTLLIAATLNGTYVDPAVGDMSGDGMIDVQDVTMLISRVLNGN